ncbi:ABC transporter substrate-binding protein [Prosthecobacter sp. SYSU 5D2]|uniref:ABC transporter substrate-binding protein n=1 Tax=Prosthecobacter sp. SYSU 5D2 TaxID=3134134 RepID=UPI0031FED905
MKRLLIFGIPLVALGVSGWAAWQVQQGARGQPEAIVMMLPGEMPKLNPFLPATEAERQILDLLHEPLIRLDGQGRLAPGLAESWAWHQRVTCWFPSEDSLQEAQRRLAEVPPKTRKTWELEEVTTQGLSLVLRFSRPGTAGVQPALESLASEALLPLTFLRLDTAAAARSALEEYAQAPEHAASTVRLWFDEDGTCELVTTSAWLQVRETLAAWLLQKGQPVPKITPLAEVAGLLEPVLEFELHAGRNAWPDGSPVTVADVKQTVEHVKRQGYPVQGREGFRHIQDISAEGSTTVRVTYRRNYGAALASWVGFPILQANWLNEPPEGDETPPGSGRWQVVRKGRGLTLQPQNEQDAAAVPSLRILPASGTLQARVALAAGSLDILWPGEGLELRQESSLDYHPTSPHNRLMILWNLRSSLLSELPVREALALGLNRQTLLAEGLGGQARLAEPLFTPGLWYAPKTDGLPFDQARALQKLEAAGWLRDVSGVAKKGGQALEFELLITTDNRQREQLAQMMAAQWKQLGVRVKITAVDPSELVAERLAPGKFDAVILGLNYDLSWDQVALWHSGQISSGLNFAQLADPQMDRLLEALVSEYDVSQLPARAGAVQERFMNLQPALPLVGDMQQMGVRRARFPALGAPDLQRSLTLHSLLRSSSPQSLLMRPPNE